MQLIWADIIGQPSDVFVFGPLQCAVTNQSDLRCALWGQQEVEGRLGDRTSICLKDGHDKGRHQEGFKGCGHIPIQPALLDCSAVAKSELSRCAGKLASHSSARLDTGVFYRVWESLFYLGSPHLNTPVKRHQCSTSDTPERCYSWLYLVWQDF